MLPTVSEIKNIVEANRQTGQTTALVEAALKTNGILIVWNLSMVHALKKKYPKLNAISINDSERLRGISGTPLFFDNTAVISIIGAGHKEAQTKAINFLENMYG